MNGKLIGTTLFALAVAAGCSAPPRVESTGAQETQAAPVVAATGAAFDCGGIQLLARFEGDRATLDIDGEALVLTRVEAESGDKYSDGTTTFWSRDGSATLERADGTSECAAQPVRSVQSESEGAE